MKKIVSVNSGNRSYTLSVENPLIPEEVDVLLLDKIYVYIPSKLIERGKEMEKDLRKVRIICIELMINMEYILMSKIWYIIATMITLSGIRKMEVKRQEVLKKYLYYEYVSILFRILLILWYVLREKVLNTKDRKWLINVEITYVILSVSLILQIYITNIIRKRCKLLPSLEEREEIQIHHMI
tara:strand:- start:1037 stop:1585 length:549 start_codon:yes stop_codon:yes gene_type:complete